MVGWRSTDVDLDISRDIQRCAAEGSELARLAISRIQGSLDPILELVFRVKLQEHVVAQSVSRVTVARIGPAAFIPSNVMRFNVDHGKHVRLLLCHFENSSVYDSDLNLSQLENGAQVLHQSGSRLLSNRLDGANVAEDSLIPWMGCAQVDALTVIRHVDHTSLRFVQEHQQPKNGSRCGFASVR